MYYFLRVIMRSFSSKGQSSVLLTPFLRLSLCAEHNNISRKRESLIERQIIMDHGPVNNRLDFERSPIHLVELEFVNLKSLLLLVQIRKTWFRCFLNNDRNSVRVFATDFFTLSTTLFKWIFFLIRPLHFSISKAKDWVLIDWVIVNLNFMTSAAGSLNAFLSLLLQV